MNIIARAIPSAFCVSMNIIAMAVISNWVNIALEFSTICVYLTALSCLLLVIRLSLPLNLLRGLMLAISMTGIIIGCLLFGEFFSFVKLSLNGIVILVISAVITIIIFNVLYNIAQHLIEKHKNLGERQK